VPANGHVPHRAGPYVASLCDKQHRQNAYARYVLDTACLSLHVRISVVRGRKMEICIRVRALRKNLYMRAPSI